MDNYMYYNPIYPVANVCPMYPFVPQYAHAYVPFQILNYVYPPMQGLERYTIFPELDRPYGVDPEYTVDQ